MGSRQSQRRCFQRVVPLLALILLPVLLVAGAQPAAKVWRVGHLTGASPASNPPIGQAFRDSVRKLEYVEGKKLVIEYR